ncbi:response regulator [Epibacterium ulvae]|uniref:ATP-binding protein n=1 Tax=Epibacterium ulvae TaxID=1156985 RepID=UPI001BFCA248|nr:ATP-binding protein [Epibacterium ulvae]MBT8153249.1 response regulator [Epibacterium ulvae]
MTDATRQVAQHDRRYSAAGLLQRYAGHKVDHLKTRLLFTCVWCLYFVYYTIYEVALYCFALIVAGDLVETLYMKRMLNTPVEELDERRAKRMSLIVGLVDSLCYAAAVGILAYYCTVTMMEHHVHWEPISSMYLLMGASVAYMMFYPLNPIPIAARAAVNFAVVMAIFVAGPPEVLLRASDHPLEIVGLVLFGLVTIWQARLMKARHERRRKTELKLVTQQRELQDAYAKMYAQQVEARRLALVAETANDSVMIVDRELKITWVNESFSRVTGYTEQEALGHRPGALLNCPETDMPAVDAMNAKLLSGQPVRAVVLSQRKDGQRIWLEVSQVPMMNGLGQMESVISVERDITATKEHEEELECARKAAEEGARSKAEFLAIMSHEIRTPLNGVIGMTQLLEHTRLDDDQRNYAETIHSSARSLLALINDILDLSKMEARDVTLTPVNFDVRRCFETAMTILSPLAEEKGIALTLDVAEEVPKYLCGDDRRITQILMNVVGNAIKFTSDGGVRVEVGCIVENDTPHLSFDISDTGIGVPAEVQERIFERFSQADAATSRRFGGTGLGLTISQRLAQAMGGEITITSQPGHGSCFTTKLILAAGEETTEPEDSEANPQGALSDVRILVAEDNQVNRVLVQKFLKDSGAKLGFAVDGEQAIDMAKALEPEIILMDLSMPNVNGLQATRAIRELNIPQPHIVALTANAFEEDRAACFDAGMDDFLSKPVSRKALLANLQDAIKQRRTETPAHSLYDATDASLRTERNSR